MARSQGEDAEQPPAPPHASDEPQATMCRWLRTLVDGAVKLHTGLAFALLDSLGFGSCNARCRSCVVGCKWPRQRKQKADASRFNARLGDAQYKTKPAALS